jgi:hypothetical protein
MRRLPLKQMAEELAIQLGNVALTYRSFENMTREDQKLLVDIIHRKLEEVDKLHRSAEETAAA